MARIDTPTKLVLLQERLQDLMTHEAARGKFDNTGLFVLPENSPYNDLVGLSNAISLILRSIDGIMQGLETIAYICIQYILRK